jgi:hypothetical protein
VEKKNKNTNSSSQKPVQQKKDMFNVKENLKKLRSGNGKEGYSTESDIKNNNSNDTYYGTSHKEDLGGYSSTSTIDRFEKINDKFNSDILVIKDSLLDHKEKVSEKLNDKVDKQELKYWIGGIIGGILLIGSIIYALSYQHIISDVDNLKDNKHAVNGSLQKIDYKLDQIEKTISSAPLKVDSDAKKKH